MTKIIDMHMHVGVVGDYFDNLGYMWPSYIHSPVFKAFQLFSRLSNEDINDRTLFAKSCEIINQAQNIEKVVCLALAPVYDKDGKLRTDLTEMWVSNEYIKKIRAATNGKALLGASVHPYDPEFEQKVSKEIADGAVLLKWLPSAQQINLADPRVLKALEFLASTKCHYSDTALPLLLHVGPEYAIPTTRANTKSYDYLSWDWKDKLVNLFKFSSKMDTPDLKKIYNNLDKGIEAGANIIFAHCGLPYIAANIFSKVSEHSDFEIIKKYVQSNNSTGQARSNIKGNAYADISAFCTPMRKIYFDEVKKLNPEKLFFGSDYPTPAFEISADRKEHIEDFKAILEGHIDRIIIPEDNLLDVNYNELRHFFGNHSAFSNFSKIFANKLP
jgi:predicted TIM-barrel fold metal-dependent hydrolase